MDAIEVGVLGATGMVGQQFVSRLAQHPWFRCTWLAASERSEGKPYKSVAPWKLTTPIPGGSADRIVEACVPGKGPKVVFSGLDASVAGDIEGAFAAAGHIVVSNARNFRMDPLVPLLIPEINADHLELIGEQRRSKGWTGAIVTNPNCSTIVLAMALAPLRPFNIKSVIVSTMQAVSGAGYPGVPSLDILGNVVPFIGGEEEKMQTETLKILGSDGGRTPYPAVVSAHTNRVPVIDGHTITVSVAFEQKPSIDAIKDALRTFRRQAAGAVAAERAAAAAGRDRRAESPAAASRRGSRRRHGDHDRPRARVPGDARQVRRAGTQYDSRRGGRGDPECRADARGRMLDLK